MTIAVMPERVERTKGASYRLIFMTWAKENRVILGTTGLLFLALTVFLFDRIFVTVPPGHVGVLWKRLGGGTVTEEVYDEGLHVILPFNRIYAYDTRLQEVTEKYDAISSDGLVMQVELSARFRLVEHNLGYLHKVIGPEYIRKLILPDVASSMRSIISNYTPEDLYSKKRQKIQDIFDLVSRGLDTVYDPDQPARRFVVMENTLIRGVEIPPRVKAAIESKIEQFHKMMEYDYRIQREAKESIRRTIEAEGIRKFQEVVNQSITKDFLTWKGIEATVALSRSNNSKMVIIGGKDGLPVILNTPGDDHASANMTPPAEAEVQPDAEDLQPTLTPQAEAAPAAPQEGKALTQTSASPLPKAVEKVIDKLSQKPITAKTE